MPDGFHDGVIALIASALNGKKAALPDDFNFDRMIKVGLKHHITAMLYYGLLNAGLLTSALEEKLFSTLCQLITLSENQMHEIARISEAFTRNEIDYMPLKGALLKPMYPKPEMRVMCDTDILIRVEQYKKIEPIMVQLGFNKGTESDHELIWSKPRSLTAELHKRLVPSYNKDYYAYYGDGWKLGKPAADNSFCYAMTDEDSFIYLFTHFAKHYRTGGIGIKHLCDLHVYQKNKPTLDFDYIKTELEKLQLFAFYQNICKTLDFWFNDGERDETADFITSRIFGSGAYGTAESDALAYAAIAAKSSRTVASARHKRILRSLFPPFSIMREKYRFLRFMPFLLPAMWGVRWVTGAIFRPENIARQKTSAQVITPERIISFQSELDFVGLDFNFKE